MIDSATISILTGKLIIGTLIFVRVLAFMASSPIFRQPIIPVTLKVLFSAILTLLMTTAFWKEQPVIEFHLWFMALLVLKEFFMGLILGFASNVVFWGARMAGGLVDFDMGFQAASMFTMGDDSASLTGELKFMIVTILFFLINGHHYMLEGLYVSLKAVPLTKFVITESTVTMLIRIATSVLVIGLKMASPIIVAMFLTNLSLALLARVAPQTNIFMLSFQLKISIGLLALFAASPLIVMMAKYTLEGFQGESMKFLMTLNGGI